MNIINAKEPQDLNLPNDIVRIIISVWENQEKIIEADLVNFEIGLGGTPSRKRSTMWRPEFFNLFSKHALEKLKSKYTIHIYSLKEIKYMRNKKKFQNKAYRHIFHDKEWVNLLIKKEKRERYIPTPFIYYDYFILRVNDILRIENNVIIEHEGEENQTRIPTTRTLNMSVKAFEYYHYIYNFISFHTTIYTQNEREPNKELMREMDIVVMTKEMNRIDDYLGMPTLPNYEDYIDIIISRKQIIPKILFAPPPNNTTTHSNNIFKKKSTFYYPHISIL